MVASEMGGRFSVSLWALVGRFFFDRVGERKGRGMLEGM